MAGMEQVAATGVE